MTKWPERGAETGTKRPKEVLSQHSRRDGKGEKGPFWNLHCLSSSPGLWRTNPLENWPWDRSRKCRVFSSFREDVFCSGKVDESTQNSHLSPLSYDFLQKEPGCTLYSFISSLGAKQLFTVRSARQSLVMSFRISEGGTYWSELGALQASWGNEHLVDR